MCASHSGEAPGAEPEDPAAQRAEAGKRSVLVGNLSFDAKPENLGALFAGIGEVPARGALALLVFLGCTRGACGISGLCRQHWIFQSFRFRVGRSF